MWDAATGQPVAPAIKARTRLVCSTRSSAPTAGAVVTASDGRTARVWDAATGTAHRLADEARGRGERTRSSARDGRRVVTASSDGTARVWDATTGQPVAPPLKHTSDVNYAEFSPDGRRVVTASSDYTARVWDAATGQPVTPPMQQNGHVLHAAFSPDGRRVVTASWTGRRGCGTRLPDSPSPRR